MSFRSNGLAGIYEQSKLVPRRNKNGKYDYCRLPDPRKRDDEKRLRAAQRGGDARRAQNVTVTLPPPPWADEK